MKVKIGSTIYDADENPIMVIMSAAEKALIANMAPTNMSFAVYPDDANPAEIAAWMTEDFAKAKGEE